MPYATVAGLHRALRAILFFNDTATTEIYTLSLHDALPIFMYEIGSYALPGRYSHWTFGKAYHRMKTMYDFGDRKSTRLNSSHANISYAVFCLKKKISHRTPCSQPSPDCCGAGCAAHPPSTR